MKKFRYVLILIAVLFVFTGCGKPNDEQPPKEQSLEEKVAIETCDFILQAPKDRDFKILQLSDTQIIDSSQCRTPREESFMTENHPNNVDEKVFSYIREVVAKTTPDLIVITGDIIYGRFDDSGVQQQALVDVMESFKIPWCPIFGNHDNETAKGINWQCEQYEQATNCLFKKGDIELSKGNYTVGIVRDGKFERILYLMNSNGCGEPSGQTVVDGVNKTPGLTQAHQRWFKGLSADIYNKLNKKFVPAFAFFHIPTKDFVDAAASVSPQSPTDFNLGNDYSKNWGIMVEQSSCSNTYFARHFRDAKIEACFVGHDHLNNFAIDFDGVKWVYGLKTGSYDYSPEKMGGNLISVGQSSYSVKPIYVD